MKHIHAMTLIGCVMLCLASRATAATIVTVDPAAPWQGFMNVFELPSNGGGYVFGSSWGVADLTATFSGPVLTLGPNSIGDPNPFWYQGGGAPGHPGNKTMDANMYVEKTNDPAYSGQTVVFSGLVLSNTFVSPYTSVAFIKDFAPDFSSSTTVTAPLTPGPFLVSMATSGAAGHHVQYGFETIGPDVWVTDRDPVGNVQIIAVPEPGVLMLSAIAAFCLTAFRRRR
jgi:PEP-CTERM motif